MCAINIFCVKNGLRRDSNNKVKDKKWDNRIEVGTIQYWFLSSENLRNIQIWNFINRYENVAYNDLKDTVYIA